MKIKKIFVGLLFVSLAFSGGLNKVEKTIQQYVDQHTEEAISLVEKVVNINSGTLNIAGNKAVGEIFKSELDELGFDIASKDNDSGSHIDLSINTVNKHCQL